MKKNNSIKKYIPSSFKKLLKFFLNDIRNFIDCIKSPFSILKENKIKKKWLPHRKIREYRKTIKIYDVFLFFNELELLEIRLNILDKYVDYFVIIESTETFTGLHKKLYFKENKHRFKKWENKIIHYVVRDTPKNEEDLKNRLLNKKLNNIDRQIINYTLTTSNVPDKSQLQWLKEFYQKEMVKKILSNLHIKDNDFCFISDLDEIWNPNIIIDFSKNDIFKLKQIPYIYYLNNRSNENWVGWTGTVATKYKNIKKSCLNHLRTRGKTKFTVIKNGGWHFSFQGGIDNIKKKLESYGHQEINTKKIKSQLEKTLSKNKDIRGRHIKFWKNESKLPKYLLENKEKYKKLFKK